MKAGAGGSGTGSSPKKSPIRGVANLAKNQLFTRKAAQRNLRAIAKVAGGVTGATLGVAAGVATGDLSKVGTYAAAGMAAGTAGASGLVNKGFDAWDSAKEGIENIRYDYDTGAKGEEAASNAKFDREFKRSQDYKNLVKNHKQNNPDVKTDIDNMLKAGITDKARMNTILAGKTKHPGVTTKQAIAYNELATNCNDSILTDNKKLRIYLKDRGINPGSDAELARLRQSIVDFK